MCLHRLRASDLLCSEPRSEAHPHQVTTTGTSESDDSRVCLQVPPLRPPSLMCSHLGPGADWGQSHSATCAEASSRRCPLNKSNNHLNIESEGGDQICSVKHLNSSCWTLVQIPAAVLQRHMRNTVYLIPFKQ